MLVRRAVSALALVMVCASVARAQTLIAVNGAPPPATVAVTAGSTVAVAVSDGPGHATDWIGLYATGAADGAFLDWRYLNGSTGAPASGLTNATVTFALPVALGNYEFRLFASNGFDRLATSTVVTVLASTSQLTVSGVAPPTAVAAGAGSHVDLGVAGGPANPGDWVGLFVVGAADNAYVAWRYLNGSTSPPATGTANATLTFAVPIAAGSYEFRFFANNGFTRLATSTTVVVAASTAQLAVNGITPPGTVSVAAGSVATVSVSSGPANAMDWVGLYEAGAADGAFRDWRYLSGTTVPPAAGATAATLSFTMPVEPGTYEFRFFADNGFGRLTTSAVVMIVASPAQLVVNGTPPPTAVTAVAGSVATVNVSNGPGNPGDWVGLFASAASDTAFVSWTYLNGSTAIPAVGVTAASLTFTLPATAGGFEFRLFAGNGYGRLAVSSPVTVSTTAQLSVNGVSAPTPITVAPGGAASVHVSGAPGNRTDWVALAQAGASETSYVAWQYLNGTGTAPADPIANATLAFTMPMTPGTYEFRLFANNGFDRLATSGAVVVTQTAPVLNVALTNPFTGTTLVNPTAISVEAAVTATGVTVSHVEFFAGPTLIGTDTSSPYQVSWSSMAVGDYVLTAVATDNLGRTISSLPVTITITDTGSNFGTLGSPIASQPGGIYGPNLTVSLAAASGATIHFTTDGSTPTESSPVYSAPIAIGQTTTVRAKAFQDRWTASGVTTDVYQIDSTPPAVVVTLSPSPNAAGWNNTNVTVAFACTDALSGVSSCPSPVVFDLEGANQTVNVTATDQVGNQVPTVVTVNIDKTPAAATISAPSDGVTTTQSSVELSGAASDLLSGVASATCNGQAATVVSTTVECIVTLRPGVNSIVLHAVDAAGNGASSSVRVTRVVTPTVIMITPRAQTLVVGETRAIAVAGESGVVPAGVTWASSASNIVSVSSDGIATVTGQAPGEATVTASAGGLSAEATITVFSVALANGTAKWTVSPTSGMTMHPPIYANRIDAHGPDLFAVETEPTGELNVVKALRADGVQLWAEAAPGTPLFGDTFGGIVVQLTPASSGSGGLFRMGGPEGAAPWTYRSQTNPAAPQFDSLRAGVAQGPDGTIYFVEDLLTTPLGNDDGYLVGLDGNTGQVKFRAQLPGSTWTSGGPCGDPSQSFYGVGNTGPIAIGTDGAAYFQLFEWHQAWYQGCAIGEGTKTESFTLHLVRVDATGALSLQVLWQRSTQGSDTLEFGLESPFPGSVAPDGVGGILAAWEHYDAGGLEGRITRVAGGATSEHVVPQSYSGLSPIALVGDGTVYIKHYSPNFDSLQLTAIAIASWVTKWTIETDGTPVMAMSDGRVAVHDPAIGALAVHDADGNSASTITISLTNLSSPLDDLGTFYGIDPATGLLAQVAVSEANLGVALFSFQGASGNPQGQRRPNQPQVLGLFAKGHYVFGVSQHVSIRIVPTDQAFWRQQRPDVFANQDRGYWFATIGAGPTDLPCGGLLNSATNRERDVNARAISLERLQYPPILEGILIEMLLQRDANYRDMLPYACFPEVGTAEYNSNSYAAGLLNAVNLPLPSFPVVYAWSYPGWTKPVPLPSFEP